MRRRLDCRVRFPVKKARAVQAIIARKVVERDDFPTPLRRVAGVDVTYIGDVAIAAAVVVDATSFIIVDTAVVLRKALIPYIPTLLAFREAGPAAAALKALKVSFDLLFVDGNGRLHPYRAGFACHLGVMLNKPTIGVAKKLLCGRIGEWRGTRAPVYLDGEVVGVALKTLPRAKPIYVSVGHRVSLESAVKLTLWFTRGRRKLPLPLAIAHNETRKSARSIIAGDSIPHS